MAIRVTGRSDESRPVVQQQPLTQSLYIPPHGAPTPVSHTARAAVGPPSQASAAEEAAARPTPQGSPPAAYNAVQLAPSRSEIAWAVAGVAALLVLFSALVLGYMERRLASWRVPAQPSSVAVITDTVHSLLLPLEQTQSGDHAAIADLNDEVTQLQETLLAQPSHPKWRWQAAPTTSDNPVLSITLEMVGVPVEPKNVLARLSNLRTGQNLLLVLAPADDRYRGVFKGFRDSMLMRSDMLSVQANDPIYVEWLTDSPVAPTLLIVDDAIMRPPAASESAIPAEAAAIDNVDADATDASVDDTGTAAGETP